ncbi:class I SAM-dependent methyltransferase [Cellulomonas fengjieae]|uniref:class I SAM-dependent methyltransferase n=1 Tax=Cellulomonas fengjieae TaxID=2819978 RepID=UPI001AAF790F|nr:class I SAM-dependent methyltransferase [Cellulomonas fengjieae]MBO3103765.1 class I SAM-dependent methyltransferase [Cellulomonas fengjieae]
MSTDDRSDRAASFDQAAAVYQATRPGYPDEAVRWAVPADARDVLDLGAGTGKLTGRLVALGWHVVAVEPSDAMRAELGAALPSVDVRPGMAERTGLPDASVDAVTIAQAWHWVDPAAAAAEIARVLRPGGQVAPIWNVRDEATDWVARWTEIVHRGDSLETSYRDPVLGDAFTPTEHATFRWTQRLRTDQLRGLAASRSHLILLPPDERDALLDAVDELVATHPDLRGREWVDVPYRTECYRARLR